jgi:hypothetical protein
MSREEIPDGPYLPHLILLKKSLMLFVCEFFYGAFFLHILQLKSSDTVFEVQ